jgi:hypothetical protein
MNPALTQKYNPPHLCKIKVGSKSAKGFPQGLDHFIAFVGEKGSASAKVFFNKAYSGTKPKDITIVFISEPEELIRHKLSRYKGQREVCGSLDEYDDQAFDKDVNSIVKCPCKLFDRDNPQSPCKELFSMRFYIPAAGLLGLWSFETHSAISIANIRGAFWFARKKFGTACGIPFKMSVTKNAGIKNGKPTSYPVVSMTIDLEPSQSKKMEGKGKQELVAIAMSKVITSDEHKKIGTKPTENQEEDEVNL